MKKKLQFSDISEMLSKGEMKKIFGYYKCQWTCQCSSGLGQWTGNYSSQDQITKAVRSYCSGGGNCERDILAKDIQQAHIKEVISDTGVTTVPEYILVDEE